MECIVIESDDEVEFVSSTLLPKTVFAFGSEVEIRKVGPENTFTNNVFSKNSDKENSNAPSNQCVKPPRRVELIKLDDDEDAFRKNAMKFVANSISSAPDRNPISLKSNGVDKNPFILKFEEAVVSDDSDVEIIQVINKSPKRINNVQNCKLPETKQLHALPISTSTPKSLKVEKVVTSQSCSETPKPSTSKTDNSSKDEQENILSGKDLLDKLQDVCRKGNLGNLMEQIENKLTKYSLLSPDRLSDPSFIELVTKITKEIESILSIKDFDHTEKISIANKIKMVLQELKRGSVVVSKRLNLLYKVFLKCQRRIEKLEEMEVESDEEDENVYVLLGRYREKANQVYNKICELEEKAPHADRQYLQRFTYCGRGPLEIQRALEKYYNITRKFPDFKSVLKITTKINEERKLNLSSYEEHETAKQIFIDFCEKLKNRRQLDDYHIMVGYIPEGHRDPAMYDQELKNKLDKNKHLWKKKEQEVLDFYAKKQTEIYKKKTVPKSDENDKNKNADNNCVPIASTSSANDVDNNESENSLASDSETDEDMTKKTDKNVFSDSEDERELLSIEEEVERKRKCVSSDNEDDQKNKFSKKK